MMFTLDVETDMNLKLLMLVAQAESYRMKMHLFVCLKRFRIAHHLYPW